MRPNRQEELKAMEHYHRELSREDAATPSLKGYSNAKKTAVREYLRGNPTLACTVCEMYGEDCLLLKSGFCVCAGLALITQTKGSKTSCLVGKFDGADQFFDFTKVSKDGIIEGKMKYWPGVSNNG